MSDDPDTPPLRIVHCLREPTGGLFRHVRDLIGMQAANGHQVGILCDSTTGSAREDALLEELRPQLALGIHRIAMQRHVGFGDAAAALKAYRSIKKLRPDILHGHGAKGGVYARLFGSVLRVFRFRVARIYSPHGGSLHFDEKTHRGRAIFLIERLFGMMTDATLFVSTFEKRIYEEKVGKPYNLHAVVYNGLADEEFVPVTDVAEPVSFVFVGTMRDLKGPDMLIRALAQLNREKETDFTAILVGDGPEKPELMRLTQQTGLADRIRFLPGMGAREAFALGSIVVVPSRAEAFPYIVLEALAAGKAVIASRVGGIPEVFGSTSAALVEPDVESLADKLLEAASDKDNFHAQMPDLSRLHDRFNLQSMAHSIELIYLEAHS